MTKYNTRVYYYGIIYNIHVYSGCVYAVLTKTILKVRVYDVKDALPASDFSYCSPFNSIYIILYCNRCRRGPSLNRRDDYYSIPSLYTHTYTH